MHVCLLPVRKDRLVNESWHHCEKMDKRRKQSNVPENTLSSSAVNHREDLTMMQAGYMGTYVEAVFTENYQPTVTQATQQPFF